MLHHLRTLILVAPQNSLVLFVRLKWILLTNCVEQFRHYKFNIFQIAINKLKISHTRMFVCVCNFFTVLI